MKKKDFKDLAVIPKLQKASKAYDNKSFIHSSEGRILRILSEYLYPKQHLRKQNIEKTIVFFGSARTPSKEQFEDKLSQVQNAIKFAEPESKEALELELFQLKKMEKTTQYYDDAVKFATLVAEWSKTLPKNKRFYVCTGGGPGIMEAANRGAYFADEKSVGLNISLPFEQYPNPFIHPDLNFEFHYFFTRKFWFVYQAQATVMFPGGFGTLDEMAEILTLLQTHKITRRIPIVFYSKEFWSNVINFEYLVEMGMISRKDLDLFVFANTPEEGFEYLKEQLTLIHKL